MPDLNVRWVSALSWYFLNLFGLNGVFKLILGQENCKSTLPAAIRWCLPRADASRKRRA